MPRVRTARHGRTENREKEQRGDVVTTDCRMNISLVVMCELCAFSTGWLYVPQRARREFKFCFGRQARTGPFRIGQRVFIGHVYDGKVPAILNCAVRPFGMSPICALHVAPPVEMIVQSY